MKSNSIVNFPTLGRSKGTSLIFLKNIFKILSLSDVFICALFCDVLFFGQRKSLNRIKL